MKRQGPAERKRRDRVRAQRKRDAESPSERASRNLKAKMRARAFAASERPPDPAAQAVGTPVVEWIERLVVASGPLAGKNFKLGQWQRQFVEAATGGNHTMSILSTGRKSGKTALVALIALAYLIGPLNRQNWAGIAVSLTARHSRLLLRAIKQIAAASDLSIRTVATEARGARGALLETLSADKATGIGSDADLVLVDELGSFQEGARDLWQNSTASVSARAGSVLVISTRGGGPLLEEIIDTPDPDTHLQLYTAREGAALDDESSWYAANPSLGTIKSLEYMRKRSREVLANPAGQAGFMSSELNQPFEPTRRLVVSLAAWKDCVTADLPERRGPAVVGLDLGGAASMTALAVYWYETGRLESWAAFPAIPDLAARGKADGVGQRYETMQRRAELTTFEGRITPISAFLLEAMERLQDVDVACLLADRFKANELLDVLSQTGCYWPPVFRGMGFKDGSEDVQAFQKAVIGGKVAVAPSLLLESALADSAVVTDAAGNSKVDRSKSNSRIDALSATILAVAEGERMAAAPVQLAPAQMVVAHAE